MKGVEQAGHFTFLPMSSSGTRSSRLHWGQWTVVAIKGLVSPGGVGERGVSRAAHVVSGFDPRLLRARLFIRSPLARYYSWIKYITRKKIPTSVVKVERMTAIIPQILPALVSVRPEGSMLRRFIRSVFSLPFVGGQTPQNPPPIRQGQNTRPPRP